MEETKGGRSTERHKHRILKETKGMVFGIRKGFRERRHRIVDLVVCRVRWGWRELKQDGQAGVRS